MSRFVKGIVSLFFGVVMICSVRAESGVEQIKKTAADLVASGDPVAMSVVVIHQGKIIQWHHGYKDLKTKVAPDGNTFYEIGSMSKVFTSILLAHDVCHDKVKLTTPLRELLPKNYKVPKFGESEIELQHLATHTSGLPRLPAGLVIGVDQHNPYAHIDEEILRKLLAKHTLTEKPGKSPRLYSNFATGLLGFSLGKYQEADYGKHLTSSILRPLEMSRTCVTFHQNANTNKATPYSVAHTPVSYWYFPTLAGAGGIRSCLNDMTTFLKFCLHPKNHKLKPALEMTLKPRLKFGNQQQCLGWMLAGDGTSYWHNGMTGGFSSYMAFNRKFDVAVCVLASSQSVHITGFGEQLLRNFTSQNHKKYQIKNSTKISFEKDDLKKLAGIYKIEGEPVFDIRTRNNRLFVKFGNQMFFEVVPETKTRFKYTDVQATLDFTDNTVTLNQNGIKLFATKE